MALLVNTPNNPSGVVYSTATLKRLAEFLEQKQEEYGHDIFLISDEPYREIVFDGVDAPYVSKFMAIPFPATPMQSLFPFPGKGWGMWQQIQNAGMRN